MLINYKKSVIRQRKPSEESRSRKKRKALLNCVSTVFSEIERRSAISLYDKSMAADLTQNVFLKIWEKHETIDPEQNFDAYLFTIARNLVYKETENRLLSEKLTESLQRQLSDVDSLMEERIDAESLREYINSLIEELPPSRREIFRLSRHEHLSYREIAERLSISEKTVETQVNRALRFLRDRLSSNCLLAALLLFLINEC